jgi:hypothetical protein
MTSKMDSPGTRTGSEARLALATFARLTAVTLAIPAALTLIEVTGRILTGEFPLGPTWAGDIIITYVQTAWTVFEMFSPRQFNELDPPIQGLLIFLPNLTLVFLGILAAIHLVRSAVKR